MITIEAPVRSLLPGMGTIKNYVVPGLDSILLARTQEGGCLRLFHSTRDQEIYVVPHNHRYDFTCYVLDGGLTNILYLPESTGLPTHRAATYNRETHSWDNEYVSDVRMYQSTTTYAKSESYSMKSDEFHSVTFLQNTKALMMEGPPVSKSSKMLIPLRDGQPLDILLWKDWMQCHD